MTNVGVVEQQAEYEGEILDRPHFENRPETIRYGEIILTEARLILREYLPEALPDEPTEVLFGIFPQLVGMFQGKHYIILERIVISRKFLQRSHEQTERTMKAFESYRKEHDEFIKALKEEAKKDEPDFDSVENKFSPSAQRETQSEPEKEDWEEPEKLLEGRHQYSTDTWRSVMIMVHELIHQRQAELHPEAFATFEFTPEDLGTPDLSKLPKSEVSTLLQRAHRGKMQCMDERQRNSLFYPVIEGTAVIGAHYVASRLVEDLYRQGLTEAAVGVRDVRSETLRANLKQEKDMNGESINDPYHRNYKDGVRILKKLLRKVDPEKIVDMIINIDLTVLRSITKGSTEYQQIIDNPLRLSKLQV